MIKLPLHFVFNIVIFALLFQISGKTQCDSLDLSYGVDGYVNMVVSDKFDQAGRLQNSLLTPDGIVLIGSMEYNGIPQGVMAYYNFDGTPKASFAGGGWIRIGTGESNSNDYFVTDVAVQEDGKLILVGHIDLWSNYNIFYSRYNPDGSLDTSFGGFGTNYDNLGEDPQRIQGVEVRPNGKIIMWGNYDYQEDQKVFRVFLDQDGYRDESIFTDGYHESGVGGSTSVGITSVNLFDSLLFDARRFYDHDVSYSATSKIYCSNFGEGNCEYFNGQGTYDFQVEDYSTYVFGSKMISENRLLIFGDLEKDGDSRDYVALFNSDGVLDSNFGEEGVWSWPSNNFSRVGDVYFEKDHIYVIITRITDESSSILKLDLNGYLKSFTDGTPELFLDLKYIRNAHRTPDNNLILTGTNDIDYRLAKIGCREVEVISSTIEILGENELNVFPNPFTNAISISNFEKFEAFNLFDSKGKFLDQYKSKAEIDLSQFNNGLYFFQGILKNREGYRSTKVLKF